MGWADEYFEHGYELRWGLPAPSDTMRRQADGLWQLLRLSAASRVVDIGCGHGRHLLPLAERGAEAVGVDASVRLLSRARQLATELDVPVGLVRGDMRRLPIRSGYASAGIMLDAFGFFDSDEEDAVALRDAARVLRRDGRFVLKVANGRPILDAFRVADREERADVTVDVSRTLTFDPPHMTERITIRSSAGPAEYERRQRLYRVDEIRVCLEENEFVVEDVFAESGGGRFDPAMSTAMWAVCHRRSRVG